MHVNGQSMAQTWVNLAVSVVCFVFVVYINMIILPIYHHELPDIMKLQSLKCNMFYSTESIAVGDLVQFKSDNIAIPQDYHGLPDIMNLKSLLKCNMF